MNDYYYIINSLFKIKKSIIFVHLKEISFLSLILILSVCLALAIKASFFLFSLFLPLFMGFITLFGTIHGCHCIILATF